MPRRKTRQNSNGRSTTMKSQVKQREHEAGLALLELDPASVVDDVLLSDPNWAHDIITSGELRETCPECLGHRLQLVPQQKGVKRICLFCDQCRRCFDALHPDGRSALSQI